MLKTYLTVKDYLRIFAIGLGVFVATPSFSQSSPIASLQKQVALDREDMAFYGQSIDIDGDFAVVGAPNEDGDESGANNIWNAGAAYIYRKNANGEWVQTQKLVANDRSNSSEFGRSVSISGDYVIVGTPQYDSYDGRVYVFRKNVHNEFVQIRKLGVPYGDHRLREFGTSVKVEGNILVIGAPNEYKLTPDFDFEKLRTKAYVYKLNDNGDWKYVNKIQPAIAQYRDQFGSHIDIQGTTIIIGASDRYNAGGSAHIFDENASGTWVETKTLSPTDSKANDRFGSSVSLHGNIAVIGAEDQDSDSPSSSTITKSGAAYIFEKQNGDWVEIQKIVASDRDQESSFGYSVSVENNNILVGDNAKNSNTGSAYLFQKDESLGTWNETQVLNANVSSTGDEFGNNIILSDGNVMISAIHEDEDANEGNTLTNSGAIYFGTIDSSNPNEVYIGPESKFVPNDRGSNDDFGGAIALSGNYAIIGAAREDHDENGQNKLSSAGSAYLLGKNQNGHWNQIQKLIPSDRETKDFFGQAVDIDGDYAIVGGFNKVNKNDGAAYIFQKQVDDSWSEVQKLALPSAAYTSNFFGWSVAISGNLVAVGAPEETVFANGQSMTKAGKIYVYEKDNSGQWNLSIVLTSTDLGTNDRLGYSLDINGNDIIAGAYFHNPQSNGSTLNDGGAAYIFSKQPNGSWVQSQKLIASNLSHADYFGYDVAIDNDIAIVGAYGQDQGINDNTKEERAGGAYIFKKENGTWGQVQELIADDRESEDRFGSSVAIHGNNIIIGAYGDDKAGSTYTLNSNKAGAAYAYHTADFNQWNLIRKINSDIREEGDEFGKSVAIFGDDILIGAPGEKEDLNQNNSKNRAGAAYFYSISTTPFAKTIFDTDNADSTTGIEELDNAIKAFPNPVENQLTIQLDNVVDNMSINIINLNGQVVEQLTINNQDRVQLDLAHLTAGVYFVKINTEVKSHTIRIIKN